MRIVDWPVRAWDASVDWSRRRSKIVDHAWRAKERYSLVLGGRLAAAIAYYGFFAVFALALVAYSIVGYVLANSATAVDAVNKFLQQYVPFLNASQIADARNTVAVLGLIGLVLTGVGWIEAMRSSQRAVWGLDQQPGNFFIRRLVDLGMLAGIGLLLALSLWIQAGINDAVVPALFALTPKSVSVWVQDTITIVAQAIGILLSLLINMLLAACLLSAVSRLRMSFRRLLTPMLLVAVGLLVLSSVGRLYINYSAHRPAYQIVGGTVALLLFLYLFNQLLLFGAAWAATSYRGKVLDLALGPQPEEPDEASEADGRANGEGDAAGNPPATGGGS